jgi:acetyl-CoA acetyltransferase
VATPSRKLGLPCGRYGVATMCVGVGQGQAALFQR